MRTLTKTARIWERATGNPLGPPLQHDDSIFSAAFSPDGTRVLTAGFDRAVRVWNMPRPLADTPEQMVLWSEVATGMTLHLRGDLRILDAAEWHHRRSRLDELGAPGVNGRYCDADGYFMARERLARNP